MCQWIVSHFWTRHVDQHSDALWTARPNDRLLRTYFETPSFVYIQVEPTLIMILGWRPIISVAGRILERQKLSFGPVPSYDQNDYFLTIRSGLGRLDLSQDVYRNACQRRDVGFWLQRRYLTFM